jgi:hypothetical protein
MDYMSYDTLAASFMVLLAACAALAVIWGAVKAVREIRKPTAELHAKVEEHERKLLNDHERLDELKEASDLQMEMLLQLANHAIDGNHTAQMIEVRDRMQRYLIKK